MTREQKGTKDAKRLSYDPDGTITKVAKLQNLIKNKIFGYKHKSKEVAEADKEIQTKITSKEDSDYEANYESK